MKNQRMNAPGRCKTKTQIICLCAIFVFCANIVPLHAEENMIDLGGVLKFLGGIAAGYALHEGAHLLAAETNGIHTDWQKGSGSQLIGFYEASESNEDGLALNSAGMFSQIVSSEFILQSNVIDKNNDFVRGMMAWNVCNTILYSLDYWFLGLTNKKLGNFYEGDIQGIETYSDKRSANVFALSMAAMAAVQGYRFMQTQSWAPAWFQNEKFHVNFVPSSADAEGFALTFSISF